MSNWRNMPIGIDLRKHWDSPEHLIVEVITSPERLIVEDITSRWTLANVPLHVLKARSNRLHAIQSFWVGTSTLAQISMEMDVAINKYPGPYYMPVDKYQEHARKIKDSANQLRIVAIAVGLVQRELFTRYSTPQTDLFKTSPEGKDHA